MNEDSAVTEIIRKIEREKAIINAANMLRQATNNASVISRGDSQIRDAQRNIQYFEQRLQELQTRKATSGMSNMSMSGNGGPPPPQHGVPGGGRTGGGMNNERGYAGGGQGDYGNPGPGGYSMGGAPGLMPPSRPYAAPGPGDRSPRARPNYSKLDLIKYDTAHLGPRIQLMLSQLEFKLSVEKQYKDGIEKMVRLYQIEKDRKSQADAEGRRIESNQKIQLLTRALRRYEDLHVDVENSADAADDESMDSPSQRKPLTGRLHVRINAVADVEHASTGRFTRGPETFVIMKVEDAFKGRTRATRTDRWTDEVHEFDCDKANEVEFTVYDKSGEHPVPIGLLWIRLSDLVDEIRRKRVEAEFNQAGWITADKMDGSQPRPDLQFQPPPTASNAQGGAGGTAAAAGGPPGSGLAPQTGPIYVDAWFSLEPVGRIQLSLGFVKQTKERRGFDVGLNRKGAVRQKKDDIVEQYGHKFAVQTFYNIMRCALCGDFLKYTAGMQCADCKYTCHKSCYPKVVTKCISKSTDPDEEKINHRIPHRFEAFSNMGANWCCHCGYMLPLGRKQSRKCSECKLTCHANCVHFVPDFCGMSMEAANQILAEMKLAKNKPLPTSSRMMGNSSKLRPPSSTTPRPGPQANQSFAVAPNHQDQTAQNNARQESDRFSYGDKRISDQYNEPPPRTSSFGPGAEQSVGAAKASMNNVPSSPESANRPPTHRSQSSQNQATSAAAMAANAAMAKGPNSPQDSHRPGYNRGSTESGQSSLRPGSGYADGYEGGSSYGQKRKSTAPPPGQPAYDPSVYPPLSGYPPQPHSPMQQQPPISAPPARSPYQPIAAPVPQISAPSQTPPPQQQVAPSQPPPTITQPVAEARPSAPPASTPGTGRRIGLDHFNFLAVLGKGNFGKVMLAETKSSKQLYAIKVLKKEFIIENDEVESVRSEKRVLLIANKERHPFLLNLHACFQTETRVYFVMEYIAGGDLMLHIQRGQFGTKRAQFYAAEVCLALKYFHENGVIYRDLKLDNIMLGLDGHVKIADYGLCKEDMWYGSTTSTFCGTPEFMAPEILLDKKYGRAVDWWAFGVLIYQMLLQQSPFRGEDEDEIYDAILADEPLYPIHMPRDSVSILQKLLTREPEMRLGSGPTDAQEIMSHAFFRNINWEDIYAKKVPAPFIPTVKGKADTSNFDSEFTSVTPVLTPVQSVLTQAMQEEFRGFSYSADFA